MQFLCLTAPFSTINLTNNNLLNPCASRGELTLMASIGSVERELERTRSFIYRDLAFTIHTNNSTTLTTYIWFCIFEWVHFSMFRMTVHSLSANLVTTLWRLMTVVNCNFTSTDYGLLATWIRSSAGEVSWNLQSSVGIAFSKFNKIKFSVSEVRSKCLSGNWKIFCANTPQWLFAVWDERIWWGSNHIRGHGQNANIVSFSFIFLAHRFYPSPWI